MLLDATIEATGVTGVPAGEDRAVPPHDEERSQAAELVLAVGPVARD
jgi:hypothetical protein